MKKTLILITLVLVLLIANGCEPKSTIPEAQVVIDTIPAQLLDTIKALQTRPGVFIFDPEAFATGTDHYLFISHQNNVKGLVNVANMSFTSDKVLQIELNQTTAPLGRNYSLIRLIDYPDPILINDTSGDFPIMDITNLYCRGEANFQEIEDNRLILAVANKNLTFEIDPDLAPLLEADLNLITGDKLMVEYVLPLGLPVATDLVQITESGQQIAQYIGQIDTHSIEVQEDGAFKSYQLSLDARIYLEGNEPETGTEITFDYYITVDNRPVIIQFIPNK